MFMVKMKVHKVEIEKDPTIYEANRMLTIKFQFAETLENKVCEHCKDLEPDVSDAISKLAYAALTSAELLVLAGTILPSTWEESRLRQALKVSTLKDLLL